MKPRRATQQGFSLLEVIAALLLLGIAFAALMQVAGSGVRLTQKAAERSEAAMWARSLLDSAFVLEPIRTGNSSGRFDRQFRWQLQVTPWSPTGRPTAATPLLLYKLDLDVLWGSAAHPAKAHFSTLRLASADAQPGATP
jgi:general secretion pathway protein I